VDFAYSPDDEAVRHEVKAWLGEHLVGDVALLGQSTRFTPEDWKESSAGKLQWSTGHQVMGELAADLLGPESATVLGEDHRYAQLQHSFLFNRADTIYAGSSEVQRNIIGERVLGLPRA